MPGPLPPSEPITASIIIEKLWPAAPNIINCRLPNFSMVKTAIQDAAKYSVPLPAAKIREIKPDK